MSSIMASITAKNLPVWKVQSIGKLNMKTNGDVENVFSLVDHAGIFRGTLRLNDYEAEAMQSAFRATNADEPMELRLCEQASTILKPDRTYRFTVDRSCDKCLRMEQIAKGEVPASVMMIDDEIVHRQGPVEGDAKPDNALETAGGPVHSPDCQWDKTRLTANRRCTCGAIADQIIGQIEERFPDWRSYRDLLDCIDVTLHNLKQDAVIRTFVGERWYRSRGPRGGWIFSDKPPSWPHEVLSVITVASKP